MYLGIDAGGTHTDAVLIQQGRIVACAKVPTLHDDLPRAVQNVLQQLPAEALAQVARVTLGTTLAVNAIVQGRTQPVGLVLSAGPGLAATRFAMGEHVHVVEGGLDHRGEEVSPLDIDSLRCVAHAWKAQGIEVFAVVGKFSPRNPVHEEAIAIALSPFARHIVQGHQLSGELHFPRRIATAYYSAAVWQVHNNFLDAVEKGLAKARINAPIFLLKADGGAIALSLSRQQPAQSILSGPAASVMGIMALGFSTPLSPATPPPHASTTQPASHVSGASPAQLATGVSPLSHTEDAFLLDIGGTTTDIALFAQGYPVLARDGMRLQGPSITPHHAAGSPSEQLPNGHLLNEPFTTERSTLVRALAFSSIGVGGDSALHCDAQGNITVGPQRFGPAMAFGGTHPTLMDALIVAGHSQCGDVQAAHDGLSHWVIKHGIPAKAAATAAVNAAMHTINHAAQALLRRVNAHPVYTLAALLEDKKVCPKHIWLVGGPAPAVQERIQQTMQLPVRVPAHAEVANAVGAALTLPTASLDLFADTGRRIARVPLLDKEFAISPSFSLEEATTMAHTLLQNTMQEHSAGGGHIETTSAQLFATLNDRGVGAKDIRVSCQLSPGIVQRVTQ